MNWPGRTTYTVHLNGPDATSATARSLRDARRAACRLRMCSRSAAVSVTIVDSRGQWHPERDGGAL